MEQITRAYYVYLESKISDHSSTNFAIDIEKQEKGKGIFRANPSLLKHQNYTNLQEEIIMVEMLQSETNWLVNDRITYLYGLLINIKSKVTPINVLLNEKLDMEPPTILEKTMWSIGTYTITYQGTVSALRRNKKTGNKFQIGRAQFHPG